MHEACTLRNQKKQGGGVSTTLPSFFDEEYNAKGLFFTYCVQTSGSEKGTMFLSQNHSPTLATIAMAQKHGAARNYRPSLFGDKKSSQGFKTPKVVQYLCK